MKEAMHYKKLKDSIVQCQLCPNFCTLKNEEYGKCRVRQNIKGKLYALSYGKACSTAIDPIEKKPLFHFLPSSEIFSIATAGCNMRCFWCQNWEISQSKADEVPYKKLEPKEIVRRAVQSGCKSIAYTYTEPTIFYEHTLEIAKLAKRKGLKNVTVSNGYVNKEPLEELYKYIDAANIDLKGFTEEFYQRYCGARLKPILETLINIRRMQVHLEVTSLIIPKLNDDMKLIKKMCEWHAKNLGTETPLHFSRFFPSHLAMSIKITPEPTLEMAYNTAKKAGLKYVYVGNIKTKDKENTYCPNCGELVIERLIFDVIHNNISKGKCPKCKTKIEGVWK